MDDMIIVGASGGIGSYLAEMFEQEYRLFLTYNSTPLRCVGNVAQVNLLSYGEVQDFADLIGDDLAYRVVLVNAAGLSIDGMGHKLDPEMFDAVVAVNLTGAFHLCRAFLPLMRNRRWGRIINLSSVVGSTGVVGTSAYSASKAGLSGFTRTLAIENAKAGVTVNTLRLGYMSLGMIDNIRADIQEVIERSIPMGSFGNPDNIVEAIRFLVAAPYVTGTEITIDGGLLCS